MLGCRVAWTLPAGNDPSPRHSGWAFVKTEELFGLDPESPADQGNRDPSAPLSFLRFSNSNARRIAPTVMAESATLKAGQ